MTEHWRDEADRIERERERARRERKRFENQVVDGHQAQALREQFETRLAVLELAHRELSNGFIESMRAVTDAFNRLADLPSKEQDELRELKILVAKQATALAELRESRAEFRFAREQNALPPPKLDS